MKEKLKRLYHSISFRLTAVLIIVFLIASYYSNKTVVYALNLTTGAEDCLKTSQGVAEVINAKAMHIEDLLRFGVLADINGLDKSSVLKASLPLKDAGLADSIYFVQRTQVRLELDSCLKAQEDKTQVCWTEPYFRGNKLVITVALRVGDHSRLLCADVQTQWIDSLLNKSLPVSDAQMCVLSSTGRYISHPDSTKLGQLTDEQDRSFNEEGFGQSYDSWKSEGESSHSAVYRDLNGSVTLASTSFGHKVEDNGWYVRCSIPVTSDGGNFNMIFKIIVVSLFSLTFFFVFLTILIVLRRSLKPLGKITYATQEIAKGNFNAPLPKMKSHNEIRILRDNFEQMQVELSNYIEDLKQTTEQKVSMERDLQIAHEIQQGLLPQTFPAFPERNDLDIYGMQIPARTVGGDLFDFFMRDNKLYFCIGDVSGKGVPAALFMAIACRLFRHSGRNTTSPVEIVSAINDELSNGNERNMFCTLLVGVLDMESGELNWCNAGHNAPVFVHNNKAEFLELKVNIPTGVFEQFVYQGESMQLQPGDALFLYTDGVTEAENTEKDLFGDDATLNTVSANMGLDMQSLSKVILTSVQTFANGAEQSDDLTILCLRYKNID